MIDYRLSDVFLLTHPVWDVTRQEVIPTKMENFLLTHPVWDVTKMSKIINIPLDFSTHTSRVGCDTESP